MELSLPIRHLSYSALTCYLRSPYDFWRRYVVYTDDSTYGPAALVGTAFHKALECYYSGLSIEQGIEVGLRHISTMEMAVNWGKTGSLEQVIKDFRQTLDHYFASPDNVVPLHRVMATELDMYGKVEGVGIQLKAVADLVVFDGDVEDPRRHMDIYDFKKVTSFSKPPVEEIAEGGLAATEDELAFVPPGYWIQAAFNFWTASSALRPPRRMVFQETKTSKNRGGSPQVQEVVLNFDDPRVMFKINCVKILINKFLAELSLKKDHPIWLPNVTDSMSGEETWKNWVSDIPAPATVS